MGGGASSGEEATIGAAKARGEDMDDGVDDRVGILLNACQSVGVGAWGSGGGGGGGGGGEGAGVKELVVEERSAAVKGSSTLDRL